MIRTLIRRWGMTTTQWAVVLVASVLQLRAQPCRIPLVRPDSIAVLRDGRLLVIDTAQGLIFQVSTDGKSSEFAKIPGNKKQEKVAHPEFDGSRRHRYVALSQDGEIAINGNESIVLIRSGANTRTLKNWFPTKGKHTFPFLRGLAYDDSSSLWGLTSESMDTYLHPVIDGSASSLTKLQKPLGSMPIDLHRYVAGGFLSMPYSEHCIWVVGSNGEVQRFAGQFGLAGANGGDRLEASFRFPEGLATLPDGTVFISDTWNHAIRRIDPLGQVTVFAGRVGDAGVEDGESNIARFCLPSAMAAAPDGSIYVLDTWTHAVRRLLPTGRVQTVVVCNGSHHPWKKQPLLSTDSERQMWLGVWWNRIEALSVDEACDLMLPAILGMTERRGRLHSFSTNPGWDDDLNRFCNELARLYFGVAEVRNDEVVKSIRQCLKSRGLVGVDGKPIVNEIPSKDQVALAADVKAVLTREYRGKSVHRTWSNKYAQSYHSAQQPTGTSQPQD